MHDCWVRPCFDAMNKFVPANHNQLPFLDVFIIKMFAAPCKFADPPAIADVGVTMSSVRSISPQEQRIGARNVRTIAPDMRTELVRISASTLEFLGKVSQVKSVRDALRRVSEKAALLNSLELWAVDFKLVQIEIGAPEPKAISVSFMHLFHSVLKIILLRSLDSTPDLYTQLQTEEDRFQAVANNIDERWKAYRARDGIIGGQEERSKCVDIHGHRVMSPSSAPDPRNP